MKQVDLKNILETQANLPEIFYTYEMEEEILRIMREACNQTVDLCAENATLDNAATEAPENKNQDYISHYISRDDYNSEYWITVDKQSILDTKKQIV